VSERVDKRHAVAPDHHRRLARPVLDALDRIGECEVLEQIRAVEHVADGRRQLRIVPREDLVGHEDAADALLDRGPRLSEGHSLAVADEFFRFGVEVCFPHHLRRRFVAPPRLRLQRVYLPLLGRGEGRAGRAGVDQPAGIELGPAARRVLPQRRDESRRSLEDQSLSSTDAAIDDRSLEQLAGLSDQVPGETGEPGAVVNRL
jgi:hypothetical protein